MVNSLKIENELQIELEKLIQDYGRCRELTVKWVPEMRQQRERESTSLFGDNCTMCGEVKDRTIYIYETELEECIHTLRHEFFEYLIDHELVGPYVSLYNKMFEGYEKAFQDTQYKRKEALIEILVEKEAKRRENERK